MGTNLDTCVYNQIVKNDESDLLPSFITQA